MLTSLQDAERIFAAAKELLAEHRKYQRIQDRYPRDGTPKQMQKANADLNWQAFHIVKLEHNLHAACADGGIADVREADSYQPYVVNLSGWHEYEVVPPKPKRLAA